MTPERWKQVTETFHAALACAAGDREVLLREIAAADAGLSREVESLLAAHRNASHFGSTPIAPRRSLLRPGTDVGPYKVERLIGVGGMGEVYRARDSRLERHVALKVLSPQFSDEPERLEAFAREARLLASLNHPHVGAVYGLEYLNDAGSPACALVMEFVDGDDLADRIARSPIPVPEALRIAGQISEALEAAHEQAIIHCDLKPSNIKVREDGTVKLIDFGLAKVLEHSARATRPIPAIIGSTPGTFGTAAYMSPERVHGKPPDQRTDIWAFGVLMYEMVTGRPLYTGTATDILRSVSERELDLTALPANLPAAIHSLIERCLRKNPRYRLQAIGEARIILEEALDQTDIGSKAVAKRTSRRLFWRASMVMAAGATAVTALVMAWRPWAEAASALRIGVVRMSAELGVDAALAVDATAAAPAIALSPKGDVVAFVAKAADSAVPQIYVRHLAEAAATRLAGTEGAHGPFFSPDGRWLGFFADGQLRTISVMGGEAVAICDAPNGRGGAWGPDGTIVFSPDNRPYTRLLVVRSTGGEPEPLPSPPQREWHQRWPQVLPGGTGVLYTANDAAGLNDANLVVQPLPGGARKVVHRGGFHGRYVSSGHLLYVHDGALFAVTFDIDQLEATGQPVRVLDEVVSHDGTGGAQFDVSQQGTLVYLPGPVTSTRLPIHWLEREGPTTVLRATPSSWFNLRFAPDGRRIAMEVCDEPTCDVYVYEWERDGLRRVTRDRGHDGEPVWTPDGARLTFYSERGDGSTANLYWQNIDRPTEAERLTESQHVQLPGSWHPSGRFLAFEERPAPDTGDLMILAIEGDEQSGWRPATPTVFLSTPANEREPMFSPDGRWLAYSSNESGRYEVYVQPFPGPGARAVVSEGGGSYPTWSRTAPELYYGAPTGQIMAAAYTAEGETFRVKRARPWAEARYALRGPNRMFDLHPDGRRFAVAPAQPQDAGNRHHFSFIFNFFAELRDIARQSAQVTVQ